MAQRPKPAAKPAAKPAPRPVDANILTVRGLLPRDVEALDAFAAKRAAEVYDTTGARLSRNAVVVSLLREALKGAGAYELPPAPPEVAP